MAQFFPALGAGGGGSGDMTKAVYDPNNDGRIAVANGGTGANTAAGARTALDVPQNSAPIAALAGTNTGDQDLSGLAVKSANLADLVDAADARQNLGVEIGVDVQAHSSALDSVSGVNTGDQNLSGLMTKAANLTDVASPSSARTALGLGDAATMTAGAANGVATLDGSGKIPTSQLSSVALTDVFSVASEVAQLALTAEEGDVAIRSDLGKSYVHNGGTAGTMADWSELLTPTDSVTSVNGMTGAVTITKSHVGLSNVANVDTTTTANVSASTDRNYVTDAQLTVIGNTSGVNTGDQTSVSGQSGLSLALKSATTTVDVSAATAPTTGQVLTATDSTHATWQTAGGLAWNGSISNGTGVGLTTSIGATAAAGVIGFQATFNNTQSNKPTGFSVLGGTSAGVSGFHAKGTWGTVGGDLGTATAAFTSWDNTNSASSVALSIGNGVAWAEKAYIKHDGTASFTPSQSGGVDLFLIRRPTNASANNTLLNLDGGSAQSNAVVSLNIDIGSNGNTLGAVIKGTGSTTVGGLGTGKNHLTLWANVASSAVKVLSWGNATSYAEKGFLGADGSASFGAGSATISSAGAAAFGVGTTSGTMVSLFSSGFSYFKALSVGFNTSTENFAVYTDGRVTLSTSSLDNTGLDVTVAYGGATVNSGVKVSHSGNGSSYTNGLFRAVSTGVSHVGRMLSLELTASGTLTAWTDTGAGSLYVNQSRTHTGATTITDTTGYGAFIRRTNISNNASANYTVSSATEHVEQVVTQTSGTMTVSGNVHESVATVNSGTFSGNLYAGYNGASKVWGVDRLGNELVGGVAAGTTAEKCLVLTNTAVQPTTAVDLCQLYSKDNGAGHATLAIYQEEVITTETVVSDTTLPIYVNGTLYKICLKA